MADLNYATTYQQTLDQAYPYVLHFGHLYNTQNNQNFKWVGAKTIEIPTITTRGRVNGDRDTIGFMSRNFDNAWQTKVLSNHRMWETLIDPMDIDETNYSASINKITKVYNEEQKFPEMDAYCASKLFSEWKEQGMNEDTTELNTENILDVFNKLMYQMSSHNVPVIGRILYVTHEVNTILSSAKQIIRQFNVQDGGQIINMNIEGLNNVQIVPIPSDLMKTIYDFTVGFETGVGARQINMILVHPSSVITPVKYEFARLDEPSAGSKGKYMYYEESYEDVFILNNKKHGLQFNVSVEPDTGKAFIDSKGRDVVTSTGKELNVKAGK